MEVILNSDIARLVLGYLKDQKLDRAFREYCRSSQYLKEEYDVIKNGFIPVNLSKGSLIETLRECCEIKSMVYHFIDSLPLSISNEVNRQSSFKKKLEVLFDVITNKILNIDDNSENINKRKRSYSSDMSESTVNDLNILNDTKRKKVSNESFIFLNDKNYCRHDSNLNCSNCNTKLEKKFSKTPNKIKDDIVCNADNSNDIIPGFSILSETILENPQFQNKLVLNINKILTNTNTTSLAFDSLNINNENKEDSELDIAIKNILHETEHDSVFDAIIQEAVCSKVENNRDRPIYSTPIDNTNDDVSIKQRLRKFSKLNNNDIATTETTSNNIMKSTRKKEKCKILSNQSLVPTLVKVINTPEPNLQQIVWVPNTSLSDANRKIHKKSTSVIVPASIPIPLEFSNVSTTNDNVINTKNTVSNEAKCLEQSISVNKTEVLNKTITPKANAIQNIKTKSFSTPRRRASHIRVLNFNTPSEQLASIDDNNKSETISSPAQVIEISTSAPQLNDDTKSEQRRHSTELNGDWDIVQGMGTIIKCNNADDDFNSNLNLNTNSHSCTPKVKKNALNCVRKLTHDVNYDSSTNTATTTINLDSEKKKSIEPKALEEWKQMRSIPAGEWDQHIRQIERESTFNNNKIKKRRRPPAIKSNGTLQLPKLRGKKNIGGKKSSLKENEDYEETLEDILLGNTHSNVQTISEISSTQNDDEDTEDDDDVNEEDDECKTLETHENDDDNDLGEILNDDTKLINYTKEYKTKNNDKKELTSSSKKRTQSSWYRGQSSVKKKIMKKRTPKKPEVFKNVNEDNLADCSIDSSINHNKNEDNHLEIEIENLHRENSLPKTITTNETPVIQLNEGDIILPIDFDKECSERLQTFETSKPAQFQICLSSLLDTPFKMDETILNTFPITPRFIDPNSLDTPLPRAGFSRTSNLSVLKDHEFPTPSFPITPQMNTGSTPPLSLDKSGRSACPTDYSSSSSYYKPDESDDLDNKLDAMLHAQRTQASSNKETYPETDSKLKAMDYEYSGTLLTERKHVIENIELSETNELQIIENKDNLNVIEANLVESVETITETIEVNIDQIEDTKYSDLLIEEKPKRVECPGILERIKSFGESQKTTNIMPVDSSTSVETIELSKVIPLVPHYTLMPGIVNDGTVNEKDSSSDSDMNSSSSSSSSSTSSSSSSCSSDNEFDNENDNEIDDKSDNSKDKDWKLKDVNVNDDNNKLINADGEVRYPVRNWITPKKENVNMEIEDKNEILVETTNELQKRELEEKRLRIVAKLKTDSLKRNPAKALVQQASVISATPLTSTMVTNTKKPTYIKRKFTSTISSSTKAQTATINKPTSNITVTQTKIQASPSKRKTSTPRKVVYIDNFPQKFKTTQRTSTVTLSTSNVSNDNFPSLRYSSDSIESSRSYNDRNQSQTLTASTMIINEKIKIKPKELLKISNTKLQDSRRRKIVPTTSVRKKLSPKTKSSKIVKKPSPKLIKKIIKATKDSKDHNKESNKNQKLERNHSASSVKVDKVKLKGNEEYNEKKASTEKDKTVKVQNVENSDTADSESDLYEEFETSCHDEISKKNYYHFVYNENDNNENKLAFITKGEKFDFDGLVMNIILEDDNKLTCKLSVEKEIKIFKRKPLVKKQLESSCGISSSVSTPKLHKHSKKKAIAQQLLDKPLGNVITSPKFSIKFREPISDKKKNDSNLDNKMVELEDFHIPIKKKNPLSSVSTSNSSKLATGDIAVCNAANAGTSSKVPEESGTLTTTEALPSVSSVQKQIKTASKMPLKIDMKRRNTKVTSPKKPPTSEFDINAVLNMVHGSQN